MITDEGQMNAASMMRDAAESMRQSANTIHDAVCELKGLIGTGYGNNIERLIQVLEKEGK